PPSVAEHCETACEGDGTETTEMRSPDEPGLAAVAPPLSITKRFIIAAASAINNAACRSDGTVNRRLVSLLDARSSASAKPVQGARTVDTSRDVWFRLFIPSTDTAGLKIPVIVYFHGGGFAFLSPASYLYDHVCRRLCRTVNAILVSVNYRLAPEHRYPAPYEDGVDVLRFLDRGGLLYADPLAADLADLSRCFLVGDSAGANICHHVARRWAAGAGMVLIQPYFGVSLDVKESQLVEESATKLHKIRSLHGLELTQERLHLLSGILFVGVEAELGLSTLSSEELDLLADMGSEVEVINGEDFEQCGQLLGEVMEEACDLGTPHQKP
ncbi:hypothetical protein B296_00051379, partial [Ensete ventricosum]